MATIKVCDLCEIAGTIRKATVRWGWTRRGFKVDLCPEHNRSNPLAGFKSSEETEAAYNKMADE